MIYSVIYSAIKKGSIISYDIIAIVVLYNILILILIFTVYMIYAQQYTLSFLLKFILYISRFLKFVAHDSSLILDFGFRVIAFRYSNGWNTKIEFADGAKSKLL